MNNLPSQADHCLCNVSITPVLLPRRVAGKVGLRPGGGDAIGPELGRRHKWHEAML
jgi:hypothetical protein